MVDKAKVKKIADFLRYKTNHVRQLKHIEDDVQEEGSAVITLTSGSRRQWNSHATEAISASFGQFSKMPTRSEVLQHFNDDPVLCHIIKSEGEDRCYEKVKNFFEKQRSKN